MAEVGRVAKMAKLRHRTGTCFIFLCEAILSNESATSILRAAKAAKDALWVGGTDEEATAATLAEMRKTPPSKVEKLFEPMLTACFKAMEERGLLNTPKAENPRVEKPRAEYSDSERDWKEQVKTPVPPGSSVGARLDKDKTPEDDGDTNEDDTNEDDTNEDDTNEDDTNEDESNEDESNEDEEIPPAPAVRPEQMYPYQSFIGSNFPYGLYRLTDNERNACEFITVAYHTFRQCDAVNQLHYNVDKFKLFDDRLQLFVHRALRRVLDDLLRILPRLKDLGLVGLAELEQLHREDGESRAKSGPALRVLMPPHLFASPSPGGRRGARAAHELDDHRDRRALRVRQLQGEERPAQPRVLPAGPGQGHAREAPRLRADQSGPRTGSVPRPGLSDGDGPGRWHRPPGPRQ